MKTIIYLIILLIIIITIGVLIDNSLKDDEIVKIDVTMANGLTVVLYCYDLDQVDAAIAYAESKMVRSMKDVEQFSRKIVEYGVLQVDYPTVYYDMLVEKEL